MMKKYLFIAVLAVASLAAYAQPRAIGGRVGAFEGFSYQHGFGEENMLELELGIDYGAGNSIFKSGVTTTYYAPSLQLAATYDWIDPFGAKFPWDKKGEWHWYLGVGATGGYGWGYGTASVHGDGMSVHGAVDRTYNWGYVAATGRGGVEYSFWFPLQLSIVWRPALGVGLVEGYNKGADAGLYWQMYDFAIGVHYKF